jgi:hypothetical protein
MANPTAAPGTVVPSGALLTPTGGQGYLGIPGLVGPTVVSTDSGNAATLGSDSRIFVPAIALADNTKNGLLNQVSGSNRDLVDGTNNCADAAVRTSWRKRYYYCWHCDHPASASQVLVASGTGASAGPIAPVDASHPGIYNLVSGTVGGGYAYYTSSSIADLQLGFFTKLALRVVFKATLGWAAGAGGGVFISLTDTLGTTLLGPTTNAIYYGYYGSNGNAYLYTYTASSGSGNQIGSGGLSGWYDLALYWDSSGVRVRYGPWNGTTPPALYGPYTTKIPASTINLFWQIHISNAGLTTSSTLGVDLVEVAGEYATPGSFRGEELVTSF